MGFVRSTAKWWAVVALATTLPGQRARTFEAPVARPIAIHEETMFVVSVPTHELVEFELGEPRAPVSTRRYRVGLEPVAVATRNADEVWVVNWLSDSVSVVSRSRGCVVETIQVGDEPGDIVFAGEPRRAFVSVSGSDEVVVIDPKSRSIEARVPVFGDAPRALAVRPDGARVFVAALRSGNRTTIVPGAVAPPPPDPISEHLASAPRQGILVDAADPQWRGLHGVDLPDLDVFELDPATNRIVREISGVGTILFALDVDPRTGDVWVANTEAHNTTRFEPALRGRAVTNRVTRVAGDASQATEIFALNAPAEVRDRAARSRALSQPTGLCFSPDGEHLFVTAFGSDRVGILDRTGRVVDRIDFESDGDVRAMRGVRSCVHHPAQPLLYVFNRFVNSIGVLDVTERRPVGEVSIGPDPTPEVVRRGRPFLYAADLSGNGSMSCASCHVDGDWDGLAWDLGHPGGDWEASSNRGILTIKLHPMKGPMTTQTLRGLTRDTAPFHRRGDRERLQDFNGSFDSLLGGQELRAADMDAFAAFMEHFAFPPNPNAAIDGGFDSAQAPDGTDSGDKLFHRGFQGVVSCHTCHLGEAGTSGVVMIGRFLQYQAQPMKVPQLRDVYKRTARIEVDGRRKSGFGVFHDGSIDRVSSFLARPFFRDFTRSAAERAELERFVMAFDTGLQPCVGWSSTVTNGELDAAFIDRLREVEQLAAAYQCDLIVIGRWKDRLVNVVFDADTERYRVAEESLSRATLFAGMGENDVLTFYGVPPGDGSASFR